MGLQLFKDDNCRREWITYLLPAALGPGVYSASNRNKYRKYKNIYISGVQNAAGAWG
jgi:hypothetical protein